MDDLISKEQLINKLNSTGTNIKFDLPVEEILGENVDLDNFATLMQDAIQAYRKMVIGTIEKMSVAFDQDVVKQLEENRRAGYNHGYGVGYNEAVSDFVNMFKSRTTMENNLVEEISEQLKAGDE